MKYVKYMYTQACKDKDGDYKTKYGYGSHSKKTGSGYFVYGVGKYYKWKVTYHKFGSVGCLEIYSDSKYKKNSDDCYDKICWDTCDVCREDIDIAKCADKTSTWILKSFNDSKRKNHGGGLCSWYDSSCDDKIYGSINVFTGDGTCTKQDKSSGKKTTYTLYDFKAK